MRRRGFLTAILGLFTWPMLSKAKVKEEIGVPVVNRIKFDRIMNHSFRTEYRLHDPVSKLGCDLYYLEKKVRKEANEFKARHGGWPMFCLLGKEEFRTLVENGYVCGEGFEPGKDIFGKIHPPEKYYICADMVVLLGTCNLPFEGKPVAYPVHPGEEVPKEHWDELPKSTTGFMGLAKNSSELYEHIMGSRKYVHAKPTDVHTKPVRKLIVAPDLNAQELDDLREKVDNGESHGYTEIPFYKKYRKA
jgi:hypothetical protein